MSGTTTTSTYAYPTGSNRLSGVTQGTTATRAFTYDAAGNTIQDTRGSTAYNFTINDAGRIAQLKTGTTLNASYTYDARDRLSQRQTLNMSPAGTTQYLYDIWDHLLSETDGAGHVQRDYLWLGDEPVAVVDWTVNPGALVLYFVHTDHLHRPEMMTDYAGNVVWKATYEPFGTVSTVTGAVTQTMRFPGQYFQLEARLAYNWHRHYDSTTGRYTTADPLGVRAGPSLYGYAGLNPVMRTDRRGLCLEDLCIGEAIAVEEIADFAYGVYQGYNFGQVAVAALPTVENPEKEVDSPVKDGDKACDTGAPGGAPATPAVNSHTDTNGSPGKP